MMTALKTSHLVPKLRFPEFRATPGWQLEEVGPFLQECSDRVSASTHLPVFTSSRLGLQPQEEYYGGNRVRNAGEYGVVPPGCIVYRHMSDDSVFAFNINTTGNPIAVSKEYPVFRCVGIDTRFLHAMLNHSPAFLAFAIRQKAGGTRTRLYLSRLRTWITHLPSRSEQQKIADCLGSLDDLITAEGRKLEALRQHKQGLMQQIFPQPGETVPRLRFPEFRDAGEWEEKKIGDLSEVRASGDLDVAYFSNFRSMTHLYPVYSNTVENAGLYGYYSVPQYKKNSVTITARGTLGVAFLRNHEFMGIGRLIVVSDLRDLDPCFLKECWNHLAIIPREVTSIPQLTAIAVRATVLPIPSPAEQKCIAACLSSQEDVLTTQARKVDAIKQQKQGLLQQLFPSLETK